MRYRAIFPTSLVVYLIIALLLITGLIAITLSLVNFNQASILVEWSTASELETIGFNVLRGENPDGPFVQINEAVIPATDQSLIGGEYSFSDPSAERGITYYYLLEDIASDGSHTKHGPLEIKASNYSIYALIFGFILLAVGIILILSIRNSRIEIPPDE